MDLERAKDIMESPNIIPMTYRGKAVHLDRAFASNSYVEGHFEGGTVINAPVKDLREG